MPVALSLRYGPRVRSTHARLTESRPQLERRAEEVLAQEELAPRRWAARLAPEEVPEFPGFEVGTLYQAGTGMMAGDFYDVFRTGPTRLAAVIGDVTGHGIEPSITAFQAKYLLRVFLRQFRDPAQALEELNTQMSAHGPRPRSSSRCAWCVFDTEAGTLRYASAGHPRGVAVARRRGAAAAGHGPAAARSTPTPTYASREIPLDTGDLVLLYTDGLAEARNGEQLFGEERIASHPPARPGRRRRRAVQVARARRPRTSPPSP